MWVSVCYSPLISYLNVNSWDEKVQTSVFYDAFLPITWIKPRAGVTKYRKCVTSWHPKQFEWFACVPSQNLFIRLEYLALINGWQEIWGRLNCLAGQENRWYHWQVRGGDFFYLAFPCLAFPTSLQNSIPLWIKGTTF